LTLAVCCVYRRLCRGDEEAPPFFQAHPLVAVVVEFTHACQMTPIEGGTKLSMIFDRRAVCFVTFVADGPRHLIQFFFGEASVSVEVEAMETLLHLQHLLG